MRCVGSTRTLAFVPGVLGAALILCSPSHAFATPVSMWEYDLTVGGTADTTGLVPFTVPAGTPMTIDVSANFAAPDCSNSVSAVYPVTAEVSFLGYDYSAFGGLELNSFLGACASTFSGTFDGGVRLFVTGAGVPEGPGGTQIVWDPSADGNFFLGVPPTDWLGAAYPSGLPAFLGGVPGDPFTIGVSPELRFDSVAVQPIPEPCTLTLLGIGGLVGAIRRRRR